LFQIIRRHFQQWQSPGFLKPVDPWIWGRFLNNYQYGDPDLSAMPCYEVLNPAHIPRAVVIRQRTLATLQHPSAPLSTPQHPSAPRQAAAPR
jgi:hypothetical protein